MKAAVQERSAAGGAPPVDGRPADGAPGGAGVSAAVARLEADLRARRRRRLLRFVAVLLGLGALGVGALALKRSSAQPPEPRFSSAPVEVRDVVERVQSTGVVEPVNRVEVGAQVSGRVVEVHVDFNQVVGKGQLLALVDPELFGAEVIQTRAQLGSAQASKARALASRAGARLRLERLRALVKEQAASSAELEQAEADFEVAEAEVGATEAQIAQVQARLRSATTTLGYTKILSPIDGVVIDRRVEPGQTVAASFSTPVLFVIAQDLKQMRVLAEIDEADIGKVKEGMEAEVVVDAFPAEVFRGTLVQLRLSPSTVEGVVTYAAVILVENTGGRLRPGMTATSTLSTRKAERVLAVRNAALRFSPLPPEAPPGAARPVEPPKGPAPGPGQGRVYQVSGGPPEEPTLRAQLVELGVSDGVWTELRGGLGEGQQVVVDEKPRAARSGFRLF